VTKKTGRSKTPRLLLTDRSLADIATIEQYSMEQWGKRVAAKCLAQIEDALSLIQSNPSLLSQEEGFHSFLKFYRVNKHVLTFDIQANKIILLTVFHGSMNIPSRLAELEPTLAIEVELLHQRLR
jgi:plasmid stabilization system protein ParE